MLVLCLLGAAWMISVRCSSAQPDNWRHTPVPANAQGGAYMGVNSTQDEGLGMVTIYAVGGRTSEIPLHYKLDFYVVSFSMAGYDDSA